MFPEELAHYHPCSNVKKMGGGADSALLLEGANESCRESLDEAALKVNQ